MKKIVLFGIASSGDNYGKPYIFSNIDEPSNDVYPFSYAVDLLGENPADISVVYSSIDDNPEQMTHFRSLTKAIKHIDLLVSSNDIFLPGDIQVYCYKVSYGQRSSLIFTDNSPSPVPGNYSVITGGNTLDIESIRKGDEYNYFEVNISGSAEKPTLTLTYNPPTETVSIKIIDDESINTPFIKQLKSNSVAELVDTINTSPFGYHIRASQKTYFNKIVAPGTSEIRIPDTPKSYRIEEVKYITANFRESFILNKDKQSHELEVKPRSIESINTKIRKTVIIPDDGTEHHLDVDYVLVTGTPISVFSDPDNIFDSVDYPLFKVKPNSGGKQIVFEFEIMVYPISNKTYNIGSLYEILDRTYSMPNNDLDTTEIEITIEYLFDINIPFIPNLGYEGKGTVTDIDDWAERVKQAIETGYSPLYWTESIAPGFMEKVKDDYVSGKPVGVHKSKYFEYLNEIICDTTFIQNGLTKTDAIDNFIFDNGYTRWTCREINCMLIQSTFPEFTINYNLTAKTPLVTLSKYKNIIQIELGYDYYLNSGRNNSSLTNGSDRYVMSHSEYKEAIYDTIEEYNAINSILSWNIDDVIFLGAYIDNFELTIQKHNKRYNISYDFIQKDATGYFYYINDVSYIDNFSAKPLSCNFDILFPKISIIGNIMRFDIPVTNSVTKDFELFVGTDPFPIQIEVEFIKRYQENVRYDQIVTNLFSNILEPSNIVARDVIPIEFKLSSKPFIQEASLDIEEDFEKHINKTFSNPFTLEKYSHINVSICNSQIETEYEFGTLLDYIEPAILSTISEYYCLKVLSGKVGVNFSLIFGDLVKTKHQYVLKSEFILKAKERGIEVFSSSGNDEYTICVSSTNLHYNKVLKHNKYKMIFRQILKIYMEVIDNKLGEIGPNPVDFAEMLSDLIDNEYGSVLTNLSCKFDKYENEIYYYTLTIMFNKTSLAIKTPLMVV